MTTPTSRLFSNFAVPLASLSMAALMLFPGCVSKRQYVPETDPKTPPPPTMQGYGDFFNGQMVVEASLGRGFRLRPGKIKDIMSRRALDLDNPFAEVYYLDEPDEPERQYFMPRISNSTLPPIALRLRVTNLAKEPVDVEIIECDSLLGNFAVRPEKITIAPGESGSPDPMTSLLGLSDGEFQLKIGLKVGTLKETKILMMRVIKEAPPPKEGGSGGGAPAPAEAPAPATPAEAKAATPAAAEK